jgi:eukaryotic-like serine/threonine-protein kinase
MSSRAKPGESTLSRTDLLLVDRICDRFEEAWRAGERPDLAAFLADAPVAGRAMLFRGLLTIELEFMLSSDRGPEYATYREQFPDYLDGISAVFASFGLARQTNEGPAPGGALARAEIAPAALEALRSAGYEVRGELGRGGMGVVYLAWNLGLNRPCALKMILAGPHAGSVAAARFRVEAEAVAQLHHPGIVQVYHVGEAGGLPYLELEYVSGGSLDQVLDGTPWSPEAAARLVESLARAIAIAHRKGLVHRDLKPANILLEQDGSPKIADFGLAKNLDWDGGLTKTQAILGSPSFMAPEQAEGQSDLIGAVSDVYALGAILYVLLAGRPPFKAATPLETMSQVKSVEPMAPSRFQRGLPRDIETICLKCLEKTPARRYTTAESLAEDLRRFQAGEPILARPARSWDRISKWARRRPTVAALLAAIVFVTAIGVTMVTWQWRRAVSKDIAETNARRQAEDEGHRAAAAKREVERLSAGIALDQGSTLCQSGEVGRGLLWLARALALAIDARDSDLEQAARRNLGAWQAFLVRPRAAFGHNDWAWTITFSPDGRTAVTGGKDRIARRWDTATGRQLGELAHDYPVWSVAYSPDGRRILTGGGDDNRHVGEARIWDAATGAPLLPPMPHPEEVTDVSFSPDGQTCLTACGAEARLWRTADGKFAGILLRHPRPARIDRYADPKMSAAFSPDGRLIATGAEDGTARLWDAVTGEPRSDSLVCPGAVLAIAFSPDGRTLATGSLNGGARLWDVSTGRQRGPALACAGRVKAVAFTRDGTLVATAGLVEDVDGQTGERRKRGGEVRLWSTSTWKPFGSTLSHPLPVWSLAFSPDGRILLTGCEDSHARLFLVATGAQIGLPLTHEGNVRAVKFSADGAHFLTASAGGDGYAAARLWDIASGTSFQQWILQSDGEISSLALGPDGQKALIGAYDRKARILDLRSRRTIEPVMSHDERVNVVAISHGGQLYLTGDDRGLVRLWDHADRVRPRHELRGAGWITSAAFSPDDRTALIGVGYMPGLAGSRPDVLVWDTRTGKVIGDPLPHTSNAFAAGFSPDGRTFLTGDEPGTRLWDATTRQPLGEWVGGSRAVPRAFFPDGKRFLLLNQGTAQIWDTRSDTLSGPPPFHPEGRILNVALSRDGRSVLTSGPERVGRLWDVATGKALGAPVILDGARHVAISGDGQTLAVAGSAGRIVVWTAPEPLTGAVERIRLWVELLAGMELDSRGVVSALSPESLNSRRQQLEDHGGPPPFH